MKSARRATRRLGASLLALLLCSAAAPALAAPSATEAKLQAMQQQLDAMRAQLTEIRGAGSTDPRIDAMQKQLDAMAADLAELKTGQETAAADIATLKLPPAPATVAATLPNGKPALATADGRFTANLRAIVMLDGGKYFQSNNLGAAVVGRDLNEGTNFRRARFGIDGRLFNDFDYALIYEMGGSGAEDNGHLQEAWVQYTALRPWRIKIGAFEANVGLAAATSTSQMPLLERPAPAEIARNVAAGDSRSAIQISGAGVFGEGDTGLATRWFVSTAVTGNVVGFSNSAGTSTPQPFDEQTAWVGRVALAPYNGPAWQAHFGANYQYVFQPNDAGGAAAARYGVQLRDRPELRMDGTRLIDTGLIDVRHVKVMGLESGLSAGPFLLEGEWFRYSMDRRSPLPGQTDPRFEGWYVQGAWMLTGENRPYNAGDARFDAPRPTVNFSPSNGAWGAFEIAARYSVADLNYRPGARGTAAAMSAIRGGEQKIGTLGLNWYLNPSMRLMLDYQHVKIDRLNAAGVQIGQDYDTVAARAQLSF